MLLRRKWCQNNGCPHNFCEQADETSSGICQLLATSLEKLGLSLKRAVVYRVDNIYVNYEKHNCVFQKLQKDQPNLLKANCNYRAVHNAAKHAGKSLKFDVEPCTKGLQRIFFLLKMCRGIEDVFRLL